jgi:hypothetical protein
MMPVRFPPVTDAAAHVLLHGIVDYAGLFPPASVSLPVAVRNYAHYRASGTGWMLGRFVCPANSLEQFSQVADPFLPRDAGAIPWRLTVTGSGNVEADRDAIAAFNVRHRVCFDECGAIVDAYEMRVDSIDAIERAHATLPDDLETYLEVPLDKEARAFLDAIARCNRRAKVRTGGVVADAFPSSAVLARFLADCVALDVTFKATAGLHHALRAEYPLTYEAGSLSARMFGFLNVFLATALLMSGAGETEAIAMLEESNPANIVANDLQFAWHGPERIHVLDRVLLSALRQRVLVSYGSCSFTEPVEESRRMGLL